MARVFITGSGAGLGLMAARLLIEEVLSNAVAPGWVPTKMGGADAPDDLAQGYLTQAWLAVSDEPAARSPQVQGALTDYCARLSGIQLAGLGAS